MFEIGDVLINLVDVPDPVTVVFKTERSYTIENNANKLRYTHGKVLVETAYRKDGSVVILKPDEPWVPYAPSKIQTKHNCTCGVSSVGGGVHSDWCDLQERVS